MRVTLNNLLKCFNFNACAWEKLARALLAYFSHHYGNISRLDETIDNMDAIREGRKLFENNRKKYDEVKQYLRDMLTVLPLLYSQWSTAINEQVE
jgi:hypothetical protein